MLCLRKVASTILGLTQYRNPASYSSSSLPRATNPRLSSSISSPLCLPFEQPRVSGWKWNFVVWPFKRFSEPPAVTPRQTDSLLLFTSGCYLGSFHALVLKAREPNLGFWSHPSQGNPPPRTEMSLWNFSFCPWEPSQLFLTSVLPTSLVVVKWFLFFVLGFDASLQLVLS